MAVSGRPGRPTRALGSGPERHTRHRGRRTPARQSRLAGRGHRRAGRRVDLLQPAARLMSTTDPRDPRGLAADAPLLAAWLDWTALSAGGEVSPMSTPG